MIDRERTPDGRPQNARPRDGLGRPLPRGADGGLPRIPDDVLLPPAESLVRAQQLLDDGMPFHAHEILEGTWKISVADERRLWQGLAQLAVGLTHRLRGNSVGAVSLLTQGRDRIWDYHPRCPHGVDVLGLVSWADALIADIEAGVAEPPVTPRLTFVA